MSRRAFIVVLDAVGAGELPDAAAWGDEGSNTLGARRRGGRRPAPAEPAGARPRQRAPARGLPAAGDGALGRPAGCSSARRARTRRSATGSSRASSRSVRSRPTRTAFRRTCSTSSRRPRGAASSATSPPRAPRSSSASARSTSARASGSSTPRPTRSSRSRRTRRRCRSRSCTRPVAQRARLLTGEHAVGRVIARPFEGEPGAYRRTANRHDFSLEPPRPNYLTRIREAGGRVTGVGKIGDIFAGCDIDESHPTHSNADGLATHRRARTRGRRGPRLREPRRDRPDLRPPQRPEGFHRCLQEIDAAIPDLLGALGPDDLLRAHLGSRLRPDDALDGSLARVRAARRARARAAPPAGRHDGEFADVGATVAAWLGAQTGDGLPGLRSRCESRRADRAQARRRRARAR